MNRRVQNAVLLGPNAMEKCVSAETNMMMSLVIVECVWYLVETLWLMWLHSGLACREHEFNSHLHLLPFNLNLRLFLQFLISLKTTLGIRSPSLSPPPHWPHPSCLWLKTTLGTQKKHQRVSDYSGVNKYPPMNFWEREQRWHIFEHDFEGGAEFTQPGKNVFEGL